MRSGWILCLGVILMALTVNASGGSEAGNGGDEVALQFESAFKKSLVIMKNRKDSFFKEVLDIPFAQKLPDLKVMAVEEPLDVTVGEVTQESVAVNFPGNQLIKINRKRWNAIDNPSIQEGLALHEMLSLLKIESTGNYKFSSRYLMLSNLSAEMMNQASEVRIEKADFKKNKDSYLIVAKARWQKGSGAFEEARIDYALWKNGKSVDTGGLKSMATCVVSDTQLPQGFLGVARNNSQEIGFVIQGMSSCGVHSAKRFQLLLLDESGDFRRVEFDTRQNYQISQTGDRVQIWYTSVDVGSGPYCCGVVYPRLLESDLKNGSSFEVSRLPLNPDLIPTFEGNLNFKNFPSLFVAGLATHDADMMNLSVQYFKEDSASLKYYQQTGLPTTKSEALRLASAMKALGGTLETFEATRALRVK